MPKKADATEFALMAGRRLRAVRDVFDPRGPFKQDTFAAKLNVGRTTLSNWESGVSLADVEAMVRLYQWLGIPLDWIFIGQSRHIDRDLADRLERRAIELGATVVSVSGNPSGRTYNAAA